MGTAGQVVVEEDTIVGIEGWVGVDILAGYFEQVGLAELQVALVELVGFGELAELVVGRLVEGQGWYRR